MPLLLFREVNNPLYGKEVFKMNEKGYWTYSSYMGYVDGKYHEFVSDSEYHEMMEEDKRQAQEESD